MRGLYKYPHQEFPYQRLIEENARRTRLEPEFELVDTGIFNEGRYFDIFHRIRKGGAERCLHQDFRDQSGTRPCAADDPAHSLVS